MSADLEILDGAVPLVRNDQPWEWYAVFWEDQAESIPTDLGRRAVTVSSGVTVETEDGNPITTGGSQVMAEIRWIGGRQAVATRITGPGEVRLSLAAADTADMPLGRLSKLYIAIGTDTEAVVPVNVIEGLVP